LLISNGHQVMEYTRHNDEITEYGWWKRTTLAARTVWAWDSHAALRTLIERDKPDLAHFHNTFPLVSPAAYYACREAGVPVVQSLHNSRLFCPALTFQRDHRLCEDCVGKRMPWPAVLHACYRGSRVQTSVLVAMLSTHRELKTWDRLIDRYITFTEFYSRKFIQMGLPAEKIVVKPHFVEGHSARQTAGGYALFVGRLAPEKGVDTLLEGWRGLRHIPLKIRGQGPLLHKVQQIARESGGTIQLLPRLDRDELVGLMQGARFLVWPTESYYETFGCVAAEAFSCGVPVLASRIGVMQEIVADGRIGMHFTPGDADDLAAKVEWAWTHPEEIAAMGRAARAEYEAKYTGERNYAMLMKIYEQAITNHRANVTIHHRNECASS
jgi:glycosyltransferase involved in cell wall biosynthesis